MHAIRFVKTGVQGPEVTHDPPFTNGFHDISFDLREEILPTALAFLFGRWFDFKCLLTFISELYMRDYLLIIHINAISFSAD